MSSWRVLLFVLFVLFVWAAYEQASMQQMLVIFERAAYERYAAQFATLLSELTLFEGSQGINVDQKGQGVTE
ncbi:hypothetical protein LTR12_006581, partial [Friedmanniomyces endolithicus]